MEPKTIVAIGLVIFIVAVIIIILVGILFPVFRLELNALTI